MQINNIIKDLNKRERERERKQSNKNSSPFLIFKIHNKQQQENYMILFIFIKKQFNSITKRYEILNPESNPIEKKTIIKTINHQEYVRT